MECAAEGLSVKGTPFLSGVFFGVGDAGADAVPVYSKTERAAASLRSRGRRMDEGIGEKEE